MLYVVATPIGNLKDISLRALEVLKNVDLILCEDTRVTKKLLNYYNIKTPVLSYHSYSKLRRINYILDLLSQKKKMALVCDAGTPGISDPGEKLISLIKSKIPDTKIVPIPGPCALITALCISGIPSDRFLFLGFLPKKKKRKKFIKRIIEEEIPVVFYESPYRILLTLREIKENLEKENISKNVIVFKELTKKFENRFEGNFDKVIKELENQKIKGEFVVIVYTLIYAD